MEKQKGDIVEHKVMPGKFVITRLMSEDFNRGAYTSPQPEIMIRGEEGKETEVFLHELR